MSNTKYEVLKSFFGYERFRTGQEELVDSILSGRDCLGVMPTGGGKSICYQVPGIMLHGVTFVISPLISLMQDQVMQLLQNGIRGAYINSTLTQAQILKVYRNIEAGMYKIIYVAPERLESSEFRRAVERLEVSLVAVDEAHCISQWGQDFRPCYLEIPSFVSIFKNRPVVAAFTATATQRVREDIEKSLGLVNCKSVITGFDRPNLYFEVQRGSSKNRQLYDILSRNIGKSGIIYCSTRKRVEALCEALCERGINATRYHAGLEDEERRINQEDFLYDRKSVMVATNAFGMGINKSNVSFVVHYNMPKSLEEYYQEAGRAGRDGEYACCTLLYNRADIETAMWMICREGDEGLSSAQIKRKYPAEYQRLEAMIDYCETEDCLREKILSYFGDSVNGECQGCGNCRAKKEKSDITENAKAAIGCISEILSHLGYGFGISGVTEVLIGAKTKRIRQLSLESLKSYCTLKELGREGCELLLDYLVRSGNLNISDEHGALILNTESMKILRGDKSVEAAIFAYSLPSEKGKSAKKDGNSHKDSSQECSVDKDLYEALRSKRSELAEALRVPAYVVFSNATLSDMARKQPKTRDELLCVSGVGSVKAEKFGEEFLTVIRDFCEGSQKKQESENDNETVATEAVETSADIPIQKSEGAKRTPTILDNPFMECDTNSVYAMMLTEASRAIAESDSSMGSPRATAILASSGAVYCAVNCEDASKISKDERKILRIMEKSGDTEVAKLVTLWLDGTIGNASMEFYRAVLEMNCENSHAEVLTAKVPRNVYSGFFFTKNYKIRSLADFII